MQQKEISVEINLNKKCTKEKENLVPKVANRNVNAL